MAVCLRPKLTFCVHLSRFRSLRHGSSHTLQKKNKKTPRNLISQGSDPFGVERTRVSAASFIQSEGALASDSARKLPRHAALVERVSARTAFLRLLPGGEEEEEEEGRKEGRLCAAHRAPWRGLALQTRSVGSSSVGGAQTGGSIRALYVCDMPPLARRARRPSPLTPLRAVVLTISLQKRSNQSKRNQTTF